MPLVIRKFNTDKRKVGNNGLTEFAYKFSSLGVSIRPLQVECEIARLIQIVAGLRPKSIIEIGTANGGTLFLFSKVAAPGAVLISLDLRNQKYRRPLYLKFSENGQQIHLLRANSHENSTLERTKQILPYGTVDFLFIDGDHTYEGVKRDFEMYSPLVKDGGIIAFHDIVKFPPREVYEQVNQFWSEVREKFNGSEIIRDPAQSGCGIGYIEWKGTKGDNTF